MIDKHKDNLMSILDDPKDQYQATYASISTGPGPDQLVEAHALDEQVTGAAVPLMQRQENAGYLRT